MVESKQKKCKDAVSSSELEALKKQVADLQAMIRGGAASIKQENIVEDENEDVQIASDAYIKVMSLTPHWLTLTTQEFGRGKKFDFRNFGEVKKILYHDLVDIMEQHANFVENGNFVILDKNVVRRHGLDETYGKILTKDKIEQILSGNQSDAVNLFKACGDAQKELIALMLANKVANDEEVDLNLLDRLSRVIGYSISERGAEIKEVLNISKKA